jgi:hypothetical protein
MSEFPYIWRVKTHYPERQGQRCKVLVRGKHMNSALVEFEDGFKIVTSRNYLRKAPDINILEK